MLLPQRLRDAIARLNPHIPLAAREDAFKQVQDLGTPVLLSANRHLHRLLVGGVPVQYQKDGETRGDFVRLVDWGNAAENGSGNEWLAINQFSLKGPHHKRILRKYKYPPDLADAAVELVLEQAETIGEEWEPS